MWMSYNLGEFTGWFKARWSKTDWLSRKTHLKEACQIFAMYSINPILFIPSGTILTSSYVVRHMFSLKFTASWVYDVDNSFESYRLGPFLCCNEQVGQDNDTISNPENSSCSTLKQGIGCGWLKIMTNSEDIYICNVFCANTKRGHNYVSNVLFKQMNSPSKCLLSPCFCY